MSLVLPWAFAAWALVRVSVLLAAALAECLLLVLVLAVAVALPEASAAPFAVSALPWPGALQEAWEMALQVPLSLVLQESLPEWASS